MQSDPLLAGPPGGPSPAPGSRTRGLVAGAQYCSLLLLAGCLLAAAPTWLSISSRQSSSNPLLPRRWPLRPSGPHQTPPAAARHVPRVARGPSPWGDASQSLSKPAPAPAAAAASPKNWRSWIHTAEFVVSAGRPDQFLNGTAPQVVFVGRSNVGKSSLLNALVRKKGLAKTSGTPGKTRLINYFRINDGELLFVDVPGYGYSSVGHEQANKWRGLMNAYLRHTPTIAVIFTLLDIRHDPSEQDLQMIEYLLYEGLPFKLILTKADKLTASQLAERVAAFVRILEVPQDDVIPTSSETGSGLRDVLLHAQRSCAETVQRLRLLRPAGGDTPRPRRVRKDSDGEEPPLPVTVHM